MPSSTIYPKPTADHGMLCRQSLEPAGFFMDSVRIRSFIDETFLQAYGAENITQYGQYLVVDGDAKAGAALGYSRAGQEPLFLEQYLDVPIEGAVSTALGRKVERQKIIEIGNLAASNPWSLIALWGNAANDLGDLGEVVVATLTMPLRKMFARIGVPVQELTPANPGRLGPAAAGWGNYYRTDPWVCAGSIVEGQRALAAFMARRRQEHAR